MKTRTRVLLATLAGGTFATVLFGAAACGGDDGGSTSGKSVDEVRAALDEEIAGELSGDADKVLKHVSDRWLKTVLGATRDEVKADPSKIKSEDKPIIGEIKVSGSKATVQVSFDTGQQQGGGFEYRQAGDLVKEGGIWKLDRIHVLSAAKVPSGSKKVNVDLTDFAFGFARKEITSKDALVFHVENKGKQNHMMVVNKIPADADVQKLLQFEGDGAPPGVEELGGVFLFSPGDKADVVLKDKLAPGRYVMLCFVGDEDDAEHTPHAMKGMTADFTVQ
jgi:hypothetical protein